MSRSTMVLFLIGILLLIYGYLCRLLSIYFFWDSKHFGWILIATGLMGLLIDIRRARVAQNRNIFWVRVGVAIMVVLFGIAGSAVIMLKTSDVYQEALEFIKTDGVIKNEIGDIRGFGLIPSQLDVIDMANMNPSGSASFIITVRGQSAYRDVQVDLRQGGPTGWFVNGVGIVNN